MVTLSDAQKTALRERRRRGAGKLSDEQRTQLVLDYLNDVPMNDLVERYGVTRQTINHHVRRAAAQ